MIGQQQGDDEDWPEVPPALQERWGVLPSPGPTYVIVADFGGQAPPVYGVLVANTSETWTCDSRWGDGGVDTSSPDTSQPYPLDDLIKRIDNMTEGGI